ncbi:DUF5682 family protein [Neobacillus sp. YIM B06451]|uniref:DUF5682 family protein n=1 Tax=Neobacillus sp. YIM B06451 TaxID=3070994 RepID=UPI00292E5574|nr:DUF5682 family protein [Neobacillus sp. YIM B06451]
MAEAVSCLQRDEPVMKPHVFGVRHLSPAAARHIESFLDAIMPTAVLVEGPADMSGLIPDIVKHKTKPPIAALAYTEEIPIETILYPLADYSPEYRALKWAAEHGSHAEFIDLPAKNSFAVHRQEANEGQEEGEPAGERHSVYEQLARLAGEQNYESYWERSFEQIRDLEGFCSAMAAFSAEIRLLAETTDNQKEQDYNRLREAYMRSKIAEVIAAGHHPEKIVVVTGAFHIKGILEETGELTDFSKLPSVQIKMTLMPYSNFRLSSQSGYGAGNHAPSYFHMMWHCMRESDPGKLPFYYLSSLAAELRKSGTFRSTAEVMEGTRLAYALASFRNGGPTLQDLRDSAVMCLGHGNFSVIADACAKIEVGMAIGELPDGVIQAPIQEDFTRRIRELKLEKYKSPTLTELRLDLRENRRVKSREAAFLDRNRSFFFHQLNVLGIGFANQSGYKQDQASWAEQWNLRWTPESEIRLVETTLLGDTIELATAFVLKERLAKAENVGQASSVIRDSWLCGMMEMMEEARAAVAALGAEAADFPETAAAVGQIAYVLQFGDVRGLDTDMLKPLVARLFLRGALLLPGSSGCNNEAAKLVLKGIQEMDETAGQLYEEIDEPLWLQTLKEISERDDLNPILSGYCCALLLEKNEIGPEKLEEEVSRRLSPGIPADLGGGWFEGLCLGNKYALLSRAFLWEKVDHYIATLSDEEFLRALVFLRRAFSTYNAGDRSKVAEILAESWDLNAQQVSEKLNEDLTEKEESVLDQLNDFDFGDW